MKKNPNQIAALVLLGLYTGFILYITLLSRQPSAVREYNFHPFWSYKKFFDAAHPQGRQILLNILLFIPFGALRSMAGNNGKRSSKKRLLLAVLSAFFLSLLIESLQLLLKLGYAEIDDLIDNTLGAAMGAGGAVLARTLLSKLQGEKDHAGHDSGE